MSDEIYLSDAQICKDNGWSAGDYLKSDNGDIIQITAIGACHVLALTIRENGGKPCRLIEEHLWDFQDEEDKRNWKKITAVVPIFETL